MKLSNAITAGVSALSMVFSSGAMAQEDVGKAAVQAAKAARDVEFALLEMELNAPLKNMGRSDTKPTKQFQQRTSDVARNASPVLPVAHPPRSRSVVSNSDLRRNDPIRDIIRSSMRAKMTKGSRAQLAVNP